MKKEKRYLTIEEQIKALKQKGLTIPDDKVARKYLLDIGHYKLVNGYRDPFLARQKVFSGVKTYVKGASIDDLYNLYQFDKELRELLLKYLTMLEVSVKAKMIDLISRKFGKNESDYLNPVHYKKEASRKTFAEVKTWILDAIDENVKKQGALKFYKENYGFCPFWVVIHILSFGVITRLFSKLKPADQYIVSREYCVKEDFLESSLIIMSMFRNVCAHNDVLYRYQTSNFFLRQKDIRYIYEAFDIPTFKSTGKYKQGTNDLFAIIIIFKLLLSEEIFREFMGTFQEIMAKLRNKVSSGMFENIFELTNLPNNYAEIIDIEIVKPKAEAAPKKKKKNKNRLQLLK